MGVASSTLNAAQISHMDASSMSNLLLGQAYFFPQQSEMGAEGIDESIHSILAAENDCHDASDVSRQSHMTIDKTNRSTFPKLSDDMPVNEALLK